MAAKGGAAGPQFCVILAKIERAVAHKMASGSIRSHADSIDINPPFARAGLIHAGDMIPLPGGEESGWRIQIVTEKSESQRLIIHEHEVQISAHLLAVAQSNDVIVAALKISFGPKFDGK